MLFEWIYGIKLCRILIASRSCGQCTCSFFCFLLLVFLSSTGKSICSFLWTFKQLKRRWAQSSVKKVISSFNVLNWKALMVIRGVSSHFSCFISFFWAYTSLPVKHVSPCSTPWIFSDREQSWERNGLKLHCDWCLESWISLRST